MTNLQRNINHEKAWHEQLPIYKKQDLLQILGKIVKSETVQSMAYCLMDNTHSFRGRYLSSSKEIVAIYGHEHLGLNGFYKNNVDLVHSSFPSSCIELFDFLFSKAAMSLCDLFSDGIEDATFEALIDVNLFKVQANSSPLVIGAARCKRLSKLCFIDIDGALHFARIIVVVFIDSIIHSERTHSHWFQLPRIRYSTEKATSPYNEYTIQVFRSALDEIMSLIPKHDERKKVNKQYRLIMELWIQGYSQKEIAKKLHKSEPTITKRIEEALDFMIDEGCKKARIALIDKKSGNRLKEEIKTMLSELSSVVNQSANLE